MFKQQDPFFLGARARQVDDHVAQVTALLSKDLELAADPFLAYQALLHSPSHAGRILFGVVLAGPPRLGSYRVSCQDGVERTCSLGRDGATHPFGVADHKALAPGTSVLIHVPHLTHEGHILTVLPELVEDGAYSFADYVVQGSGVGLLRDGHHYEQILQTGDEGGYQDFSGSAPIDSLSCEWRRSTSLGGGLHLDPLLAYLRVDEACGLFLHYLDQHVRLCGVQLDVFSGCHTDSFRDDEGEATYFRGETPYPHELLGAYEFGASLHRENSDKETLFDKPEGKLEPLHNDQQPFYRYSEYGGYLGQARLRQVCLPPHSAGSQDVARDSQDAQWLGVFREQIGLDGSYLVQSAKELTLAKTSLLPVPKRKAPPEDLHEDSDGARQENYKAAGLYGEGEEHAVGDIALPEESEAPPQLVRALGAADRLAYRRNWQALHPFAYHVGDFHLPEESEIAPGVGLPDYSQLSSGDYLEEPQSDPRKVDHRYGLVDFFRALSMLSFTEDGGVVLRDGAGAEIRLGGDGHIYLDCPGNIYVRPGKSLVALAGDDIALRARKSLDASAGEGDLRLKAENNMELCSGNSGHGAMLFDNRAASETYVYPASGGESSEGSGFIFRSAKASFVVMSAGMYLRTGSEGGISGGPIVLDADKGRQDVRLIGNNVEHYVAGEVIDVFNFPTVSAVGRRSAAGCQSPGVLQVNGSLAVRGNLSVQGGIQAVTGTVATPAGGHMGRVLDVQNQLAAFEEMQEDFAEAADNSAETYQEHIVDRFYAEESIGGKDLQERVMFGFRREGDYGTEALVMPEAHWQALSRAGGGGSKAWDEPTVKYQSADTLPWPGKERWADEESLYTLQASDHTLYDVQQGHSQDRDALSANSPYKDPRHGPLTTKVPAEAYLVIDTDSGEA